MKNQKGTADIFSGQLTIPALCQVYQRLQQEIVKGAFSGAEPLSQKPNSSFDELTETGAKELLATAALVDTRYSNFIERHLPLLAKDAEYKNIKNQLAKNQKLGIKADVLAQIRKPSPVVSKKETLKKPDVTHNGSETNSSLRSNKLLKQVRDSKEADSDTDSDDSEWDDAQEQAEARALAVKQLAKNFSDFQVSMRVFANKHPDIDLSDYQLVDHRSDLVTQIDVVELVETYLALQRFFEVQSEHPAKNEFNQLQIQTEVFSLQKSKFIKKSQGLELPNDLQALEELKGELQGLYEGEVAIFDEIMQRWQDEIKNRDKEINQFKDTLQNSTEEINRLQTSLDKPAGKKASEIKALKEEFTQKTSVLSAASKGKEEACVEKRAANKMIKYVREAKSKLEESQERPLADFAKRDKMLHARQEQLQKLVTDSKRMCQNVLNDKLQDVIKRSAAEDQFDGDVKEKICDDLRQRVLQQYTEEVNKIGLPEELRAQSEQEIRELLEDIPKRYDNVKLQVLQSAKKPKANILAGIGQVKLREVKVQTKESGNGQAADPSHNQARALILQRRARLEDSDSDSEPEVDHYPGIYEAFTENLSQATQVKDIEVLVVRMKGEITLKKKSIQSKYESNNVTFDSENPDDDYLWIATSADQLISNIEKAAESRKQFLVTLSVGADRPQYLVVSAHENLFKDSQSGFMGDDKRKPPPPPPPKLIDTVISHAQAQYEGLIQRGINAIVAKSMVQREFSLDGFTPRGSAAKSPIAPPKPPPPPPPRVTQSQRHFVDMMSDGPNPLQENRHPKSTNSLLGQSADAILKSSGEVLSAATLVKQSWPLPPPTPPSLNQQVLNPRTSDAASGPLPDFSVPVRMPHAATQQLSVISSILPVPSSDHKPTVSRRQPSGGILSQAAVLRAALQRQWRIQAILSENHAQYYPVVQRLMTTLGDQDSEQFLDAWQSAGSAFLQHEHAYGYFTKHPQDLLIAVNFDAQQQQYLRDLLDNEHTRDFIQAEPGSMVRVVRDFSDQQRQQFHHALRDGTIPSVYRNHQALLMHVLQLPPREAQLLTDLVRLVDCKLSRSPQNDAIIQRLGGMNLEQLRHASFILRDSRYLSKLKGGRTCFQDLMNCKKTSFYDEKTKCQEPVLKAPNGRLIL